MPHIDQLLGLLMTGVVLYTGIVLWLVRVQTAATAAKDGVTRIDAERKTDKEAYDKRLSRAEATASNIHALTVSVQNLGERMASEMANQRERHEDAQSFNAQQFADLKAQMRDATKNAAVNDQAARRRGRADS